MILEIKVPTVINNSKNSYERKSSPVTHSWAWVQIAKSDNKKALEIYATNLPIALFYMRKRIFKID